MNRYDKTISYIKNHKFGYIALLASGLIVTAITVISGLFSIIGEFDEQPNESAQEFDSESFTIDFRDGEIIGVQELRRSSSLDFVKLSGDSYRHMIMAQYTWIRNRYILSDSAVRSHTVIKMPIVEAPQSECSDDYLYLDYHELTLVSGQKQKVYFDVSNWREILCGAEKAVLVPDAETVLNDTLDKFYRK